MELKRQHGADDSEIQELEDQAFGPGERPGAEGGAPEALEQAPDLEAEAPTEFMAQADAGVEGATGRREPSLDAADLQEPPPFEESREEEGPAEEEQSAAEHEAIPETPPESPGHTTAERHAIADQPTEMYDLEKELGADAPAPPDEDLVAEEASEARLAPPEPTPADEEELEPSLDEEDEEDDFFDEKRLSDELDQALESPSRNEPEPEPEAEPEPEPEPEPAESEQPSGAPDEDVLEETPDFLEEAPEDDQLWFEQKPPKDFDFDD